VTALCDSKKKEGLTTQLCAWDLASKGQMKCFEDKTMASKDSASAGAVWANVCVLATCPNGQLVSGSPDGTVKIWDIEKCCCSKTIQQPITDAQDPRFDGLPLSSLAVLSDGYVVYGLQDGSIEQLNLKSGHRMQLDRLHKGEVTALAAFSDTMFASGSSDKTIKIWEWDANKGFKCMHTLREHDSGILSLVARSKHELVSFAQDGTIKRWCL
jgi:WD40 repeat protein